jgi:hypothetical protein
MGSALLLGVMWEKERLIPVQQTLLITGHSLPPVNKQLAKPVEHNIKMWQELFRVCAVIGVEQREKVRGSGT